MKLQLIGVLAALTISLLPVSASAGPGLFQWTGSVSYDSLPDQTVTGYTRADCQAALENAINNPPTGVRVIGHRDCLPNEIERPDRWRVDPFEMGCIYCGLLNKHNVFEIYPDFGDLVIDVIKDYRLEEYQHELRKLNEHYNVEGFRDEMGKLERFIYTKQK